MQESHTRFAAGQAVAVRDESWVIVGTESFGDVDVLHLRGTGVANQGQRSSILSPFDTVQPIGAPTTLRSVSRRHALTTAALAVAEATPWHQCWTAATAAIDLRSWQLEPAIAAIGGTTRILLADHVGLGKTIQAALIVAELLARGLIERALFLTPPSLREQWAAELSERFGLASVIFDQSALSATVASLPVGVNPWRTAPLIVSSIDLAKRREVRTAIDGAAFDVLVVDEAHHVTPGTDRGDLVADLAARTPWVVLVTATPHSGDDRAFAFLQTLGDARGAPPLMFRRAARPGGNGGPRRSRLLMVVPTRAEQAMLEATDVYVRALTGPRRRQRGGSALVASVIARRAASSAEALRRTLVRRMDLLSGETSPEEQPMLPWEDLDANDAEVSDALLSTASRLPLDRELDSLARLAALARSAADDGSKVNVIRRLLRRTDEPILIFSEYRDVAEVVAAALSSTGAVAALHGGLSPRERRDIVRAFNAGRLRTLVATDAAGEGLNLHHRCRLVVNIELPWMPRRLEQRIGRVDRLGQTRRVHAIHLVHRGSFEGVVIARLERRRAAAQARLDESHVADDEGVASTERRLRRLATGRPWHAAGVYSPRPARPAVAPTILAVHTATLLDRDGRLVQRVVIPLAISPQIGAGQRLVLTRQLLRRVLRSEQLHGAIRERIEQECAAARDMTLRTATNLERRLAACLDALARRSAGAAFQTSLFEDGSDLDADRRRAAVSAVRHHLERRRTSAAALVTLQPGPARLIAAWPGR